MSYVLSAEHVQKKYGANTVLRDVSIHVNQGEIYGLVGRNGAGKTTLLRILTGLIREYTGKVVINEANNQKLRVAAIINDPALFLNMNALDNMREQAYLLGQHDDKKIYAALNQVGLGDCKGKLVKNFSLGMAQRLKLAMVLLESPDILILDEPVNGLDPDGIADLRELLLFLNHSEGTTIIISSHILSELEQIATCFGILHEGKIVKELHTQDVLQNGQTLEGIYMQYTKEGTVS
ncbi:MAG: ATP-binding cassette domain-containing protein [Eubacteriaceae bacterium]|nr:ATP-binding cassette domain-containing protein [Eubacteriaceae bacterium]